MRDKAGSVPSRQRGYDDFSVAFVITISEVDMKGGVAGNPAVGTLLGRAYKAETYLLLGR